MKRALLSALVLLALQGPAVAEDLAKRVSIAGTGFLYYPKSGELTDVYFSVSHRLASPVTAITFGLTFRAPDGTVLKTKRYRHAFQYTYQAKLLGAPLPRDEVYQVKHKMVPKVQGFCPESWRCGTIHVRVLAVDTK